MCSEITPRTRAIDELRELSEHIDENFSPEIKLEGREPWVDIEYDPYREFISRGKTNVLGIVGDAVSKAKRLYRDEET